MYKYDMYHQSLQFSLFVLLSNYINSIFIDCGILRIILGSSKCFSIILEVKICLSDYC